MYNHIQPGWQLPTVLPTTEPWPDEWVKATEGLQALEMEAPPERVRAFYQEWGQRYPAPAQVMMLAYMMGNLPVVPTIITRAWFLPASPTREAQVAVKFFMPGIYLN